MAINGGINMAGQAAAAQRARDAADKKAQIQSELAKESAPLSNAPTVGQPSPAAANPLGTKFDVQGLEKYLHDSRMNDVNEGMNYANPYFGQGNSEIAAIEQQQKQRAMNGLTPDERQAYTSAATTGINQQTGTGLRALRSTLSTNGVRGGAAAGAAIPILSQANTARATADNNLNIADMNARRQALNDYQGTVTGERAGALGTAFGFGSLGAGDRSSALQYGLGSDYLNQANKDVADIGKPDYSSPGWDIKSSLNNWKEHNYDPNYTPLADYLHQNVWDKKDVGLPDQLPNGMFPHTWAG